MPFPAVYNGNSCFSCIKKYYLSSIGTRLMHIHVSYPASIPYTA